MVYGTWDDITQALQNLGQKLFIKVLKNPPRGHFNAKSWNFWHKKLGLTPVPPLPPQAAPWPLR